MRGGGGVHVWEMGEESVWGKKEGCEIKRLLRVCWVDSVEGVCVEVRDRCLVAV